MFGGTWRKVAATICQGRSTLPYICKQGTSSPPCPILRHIEGAGCITTDYRVMARMSQVVQFSANAGMTFQNIYNKMAATPFFMEQRLLGVACPTAAGRGHCSQPGCCLIVHCSQFSCSRILCLHIGNSVGAQVVVTTQPVPSPPPAPPGALSGSCSTDASDWVVQNVTRRSAASCDEVAPFCNDDKHSDLARMLCPVTCGVACTSRRNSQAQYLHLNTPQSPVGNNLGSNRRGDNTQCAVPCEGEPWNYCGTKGASHNLCGL